MSITSDPSDPAAIERLIRYFEQGMLAAERRGVLLTAARLARDASSLLQKRYEIQSAVSFDDRALEYIDIASSRSASVPSSIAVQAHQKGGMNYLSLGNVAWARIRLQKARLLVDDTVPSKVVADVHWSSSVLANRLHDPTSALDHALRAWAYYGSHGQSIERSRLRIEIARHAMDLAQLAHASGAFTSQNEYLALTQAHIYRAQPRSQSIYAPAVELKFLIAYTRFSRFTNRQDDRLSLLEDVERRAFSLNDPIIQGLTLAEMGDELGALGYFDAARKRRHQAITILGRSTAPGMALPIKRTVILDEEFRIR